MSKDDLEFVRKYLDWVEETPGALDLLDISLWNHCRYQNEVVNAIDCMRKVATIDNPVKKYSINETMYFQIQKPCIDIYACIQREEICERFEKQVEVPEKIIAASEEKVIPAHVETVVEWVCPERFI